MNDYQLPEVTFVVIDANWIKGAYLPLVRMGMEGSHPTAVMIFSHSALADDAIYHSNSAASGYILRIKSPGELDLHLQIFQAMKLQYVTFDPLYRDSDEDYEEDLRIIVEDRIRIDDKPIKEVRSWIGSRS